MRHLKLSSDNAYQYIKARRPLISPNFNFLGQLSEYERSLPSTLISSSVSIQSHATSLPLSLPIPAIRCITLESPLIDRRRFVQTEGSSCSAPNSFKREHNNDQPKAPSRPKGFNFDLVNTPRPQSLLSPSAGIASLSVESPPPLHASLPPKLLRPNSITLKRSSPTDESSQSSSLINSSYSNESSSFTHKRVKTHSRSTDTTPSIEKTDLVNTSFEGVTTPPSKSPPPHRSSSTHSLDSITETGATSNNTKSRTNSLSSSRELLVS